MARGMARGDVETLYRDGQWVNMVDGLGLLGIHPDRQSAVRRGRDIARWRGVAHFVRDAEGALIERTSYRAKLDG